MYSPILFRTVALPFMLIIIGSLAMMGQAQGGGVEPALGKEGRKGPVGCVEGMNALLDKILHYLQEVKEAHSDGSGRPFMLGHTLSSTTTITSNKKLASGASSLISEIQAKQEELQSAKGTKRSKRAVILPYSGGMYGKRAAVLPYSGGMYGNRAAVLPYSGGMYGKRAAVLPYSGGMYGKRSQSLGDDMEFDGGIGGGEWFPREVRAVPLNGGFYG